MRSEWQERVQDMWVRSPRNRVMMMVGTGVIAILLLCGACNLVGTAFSGAVSALFTSNPGPKPTLAPNTSQSNNFNPTFPIPTAQTYQYPNPPAATVPSSGTPAPTPSASPTPIDSPTPPGGGGKIHFQFLPDPTGKDLVAGQTNQIILTGPPGTAVSVSIYWAGNDPCVSMNTVLDGTGNSNNLTCAIPANLKGTIVSFQIIGSNGYNKSFPVQVV
jgi:hypothetical protein